ncbi:hypothetical protein [Mesorhizobium sp. M0977]|uniref:hypothetical protein n=1 Tax=Mesorhizobium sp. M0977 TaxID=2957039 RepID=UPI003337960F
MSESNSAVDTATITPIDFLAKLFPQYNGVMYLSKDGADADADGTTIDVHVTDVDAINAFVAEAGDHDVIADPHDRAYGPAVLAFWFEPGTEIPDPVRELGVVLQPCDEAAGPVLVIHVEGDKPEVDPLIDALAAEYPELSPVVPLPGRSWTLEPSSQFRGRTVGQVLDVMLEGNAEADGAAERSSSEAAIPSIDGPPTSMLNAAEIYGEISDAIWHKKLFVSTAKKREDKFFKVSPELSFSDILVSNLSKIRIGVKDGACLVPGVLVDGRRLNQAVTKLYMMGLDVDSGASMQDTMRKLQTMGLFFVAYTTHSHGTTTLEVKKDKFFKWADDNGHPTEASVETVKLFLTNEGKYTEDVIASVSNVNTSHETSGIQLIITTRPIDKFRLLFILEQPYVIAEQEGAQKDAIRAWGDMILGMGSLLGISVDRAARDCSRLFYSPSKAKGSTSARVIVSAGRALDWRSLPRVTVTGTVSSDPFDQAASIMGGKIRGQILSPQKGLHLQKWASERAHGFQISQVFKDHCDENLKEETAPGKFTVICPFDDDHSNAGDPDDKGCFIQDAGMDAESFTFRCSHDSCAGHDRLAMLEKAMVDGWFTDDVLTDPQYDISGADEVDEGQVSGDDDEEEIEVGKATTADIARAMELASKAVLGMPSDKITTILKLMVTMGPFDRSRIITMLAQKSKIPAAQLTSLLKAIELKASPIVADKPFDPVAAAKSIKKRYTSLRNEKRPIVLVNEDHGVATLRHLLQELGRANAGDQAAGINPAHTLFDFGGNRVRIGKDKWTSKRRIDELSRDVIGNVSNELLYLCKLIDSNTQTEAFLPEQFAKQAVVDPGLQLLQLERFVKHPLFDKNGNLLLKTGYDPDTRCYIDLDGLELDIDLAKPVERQDVKAAVTEIDFVFGNFKWSSYDPDGADKGDRGSHAAFLALLLTPLVREVIGDKNVMLFAIDKPNQASGGTLLAECAHIIWTGEKPMLDDWPKDGSDDELVKKIVGIMMAGRGAIIFDNVLGRIAGSIVPTLATGGISARILGGNNMFTGKVRYPVIFVGNGLAYSLDNARRVLPVLIAENDETANFNVKGDLAQYLIDNRAAMLKHLITIVRWWFQEGQPKTARSVGSFEDFVSTMGGILEAAGVDGWLSHLPAFLNEATEARSDEKNVVKALADKFGLDKEFTIEDAIPVLFQPVEGGYSMATLYQTRFERLAPSLNRGAISNGSLGKQLGYLKRKVFEIEVKSGGKAKVTLVKRESNGDTFWKVKKR